jgi:hypothetical protein
MLNYTRFVSNRGLGQRQECIVSGIPVQRSQGLEVLFCCTPIRHSSTTRMIFLIYGRFNLRDLWQYREFEDSSKKKNEVKNEFVHVFAGCGDNII